MLDTGATLVVLSPVLAARLNITRDPGMENLRMTLADGSVVEAAPVILKSVRVGKATSANVSAVIMPDAPSDGIDGLLGVSFLKDYLLNYEPQSGRIELLGL